MTSDPNIEIFLDELEQHGRSERTLEAYERVLNRFSEFLVIECDISSTEPMRQAERGDCLSWIHTLRGSYEDSTIASYASYLNRFYRYMNDIGALDSNPMTLVMEGLDERIDSNPTRRELTVDQLRSFLMDINHPLHRAVLMTFAKTGVRVGELCNLDLRDVTLNSIDIDEQFEVLPRGQLVGRGPSLYVPSGPERGKEYNGEVRTGSNKRNRDTIIPIDAELERELVRWLKIRPDTPSPAKPLFSSTKHDWGRRLTVDKVQHIVREYTVKAGLYAENAGPTENVTPHYFRHFFTTHLRDRTGDRGIVKYLRGDVADDIIDTYTHNWGDRVRTAYEAHIYTLTG